MKRCKNIKCGKIFQPKHRRQEYCFDCQGRIRQRLAEERYEDTSVNRKLGNPKQNREILKFLRNKRKNEDAKYNL